MVMLAFGVLIALCVAASADKREASYDDGGAGKTTVIGLFVDNGQSYHQRVDFAIGRAEGLMDTRLSLHAHVGSKIEPAPGHAEVKVGLRVNGGDWHWQALKPFMDDKNHWISFEIPVNEWRRGVNTVETTSTVGSRGNMTPQSLDMIGSGTGIIHCRSYHSHNLHNWQNLTDRNWGIRLTYEQERLPEGVVASLSLTPVSASTHLGANVQFVVEARDKDGRAVEPGDLTWSADRGFVDSTGFFHPETDGAASITVKAGSISASARCEVTLKPPFGVEGPLSKKRLRTTVPEGHIDLGGKWQFRRDERGVGESEGWFNVSGSPFRSNPETRPEWGDIHVPGCWQAQGWGLDYHGTGWYRREFTIPKDWRGRRLRLAFDAVATKATAWVNGRSAGAHQGNWSPFEMDITELVELTGKNTLTVRVEELPLHASAGFPMVIAMHYGGIWQNVSLYGTGPIRLEDAAAFPSLVRKVVEIEADVAGPWEKTDRLVCTIASDKGIVVARHDAAITPDADGKIKLTLAIPEPDTWTPESPKLYTATIELLRGDDVSDKRVVRFGMRDVSASGSQVLLNGKPMSIRSVLHWGYYPDLITIDPSEQQIRREFADLRKAGFNLVKVCLFMMPKRFYDIADETGMLIWQEYPTWLTFPQVGDEKSHDGLEQEFREWLKFDRSHASIILRDLTCESVNPETVFTKRIYDMAKSMTHGGLVEDNSAYLNQQFTDFYDGHLYREVDVQFTDLANNIVPFLKSKAPKIKPYLSGEDLDADTYRDTAELRAHFTRGDETPWWMDNGNFRLQETMEAELTALHGPKLVPEMIRRQLRRALICRKALFEEYRRYPELAGYVMTDIADNPLTRPGFYDDLGRPKWTPEEWKRFNSARMLMLYSPRRSFCFTVDETAGLTIELSNYDDSIADTKLNWRLVSDKKILAQGEAQVSAERGQVIKAAHIDLKLTELSGITKPVSCRLVAELGESRNDWPIWLFPSSESLPELPFTIGGVTVTDHLDAATVNALKEGARVIYLASDEEKIPRMDAPFWREMAIWLPTGHPALGGFPHGDIADLQFVDMTQRRPFDTSAFRSEITPIIWGVNCRFMSRMLVDYVFEGKVGKGRLLACCLKLSGEHNVAGAYLLQEMLAYAQSAAFDPNGKSIESHLRMESTQQ